MPQRGPYMQDKLKIKEMKQLFPVYKRQLRAYGKSHNYPERYNVTLRAVDINKNTADVYRQLFSDINVTPSGSQQSQSRSRSRSRSQSRSRSRSSDDDDGNEFMSVSARERMNTIARQYGF